MHLGADPGGRPPCGLVARSLCSAPKANSTEFISLKLLMSGEVSALAFENGELDKTVTVGLSGGQ